MPGTHLIPLLEEEGGEGKGEGEAISIEVQ